MAAGDRRRKDPAMRRPLLALLLLVMYAIPGIAADRDEPELLTFTMRYDLTPAREAKGKSNFTLTTVLPRSIVRRQKVLALRYSQEPVRVWDEKNTRYASFEFKDFRAATTLTIHGNVELY